MALAIEDQQAIAERIAADPLWFATTMLGHDVWSVPKAIMQAVAKPRARVAVKSCHASSKTFSAAELVLWAPYAGGIAITTAPTSRQVRRLVWTEVRSMYPQARMPLGGELLQTEFRIAPDLYALGLSTDAGVNFQGFHARPGGFLLVVLDEAPGVEPAVYAAIEGIRAGGDVRVLALGNPDVPSGPFYDAFSSERAGWETHSIDAFDTPNFEDEERPGQQLTLKELLALPEERIDIAPRPYLVTRRYVRDKFYEWGEISPLWQSKVRGCFPDQAQDALLPLTWLEQAQAREIPDYGDWEAGIDVAGPGEDECVLVVRQGAAIRHLQAWSEPDPRGSVLDTLSRWPQVARVKVDSIGQGYYFARHLEDHGWLGKVVDVNVGEAPTNDAARERYANLKAELYWGLRLRAEAGDFAGLGDSLALSQLAGIRYSHNARGQVVIESKEQARKRGVRSPDRAEAIMLAFAAVGSEQAGVWSL